MSENLVNLLSVAEPASPAIPAWLLIVGTVVTVCGSVLTAIATYYGVQKARLDIEEKRRALYPSPPAPIVAPAQSGPPQPLMDNQRVQDMILRFIVLFIVLTAWNVIGGLFDFLSRSPVLLALFDTDWLSVVAYFLSLVIAAIPSIGSALIALALGVPLAFDLAQHYNFAVPARLNFLQNPRRRVFVAVATAALVVDVGSKVLNSW
ncbi:hypothetical protein [Curtobacterium sp. PsM8]|uniref:hypothetical protein n=1 Tax=Curtobacterium sp. PsM8 TaxID=3030532 RepID=UPI00263B5FD6|nr:hypothetical protein [Curtobacterium sp. PsM8]MDN4647244.1 hypothetical protein [Curtobacterium sp. PsM8]